MAFFKGNHRQEYSPATAVSVRFCFLLFMVFFVLPTHCHAFTTPPIENGKPVRVTVLLYILDLDNVDSAQQNFTANVYIEASWMDPRLASDAEGPIFRSLDEIWFPKIQILNQQKIWKTFPDRLEVFPDGKVMYRQRVWGNFSQPMNLRNYPADTQQLTIQLVASGYGPDIVEFVPSDRVRHAISDALSVADFEITGSEVVVEPYDPINSGEGSASIRSTYFARRKVGYFLVKVIIPLILIVMMSWTVFWIDPAEAGTQIGVATTSMLTLIAFRFATDSGLPKISYLTRLDTFIMASTVLVFLSLFEVVLTSKMAKSGRHERALRFDRWSRILFPGAFVCVVLLTLAG